MADFQLFAEQPVRLPQGSGAAVNPRAITGLGGGGVIGIDFSNAGVLYAATTTGDNSLYRINPVTGAATLVGSTGLTVIEGDIGFDPTTNTLYGLYGSSGGGNQLFTINLATGATTVIGTVASDEPSGLAFDAAGNL